MTLKERITEDMKSAMRAGDKERLATIRLALAAIKQREADERITLDDRKELDVLIASAIASTGATSAKDMGKVMAVVKSQAQGRADMGAVSARVKEKLAPR